MIRNIILLLVVLLFKCSIVKLDEETTNDQLFFVTATSSDETNATSPDEVLELLEQTTRAHNELRKRHGVGPLMINPELVDLAQIEAEKFAETGHIRHVLLKYRNQSVGQNFALSSHGLTLKGDELSNLWYSSGKSFEYKQNSLQSAQSFTQLIWKSSREIGLGLARKDNSVYIICLYFPAGNMVEQIAENVFPPKS